MLRFSASTSRHTEHFLLLQILNENLVSKSDEMALSLTLCPERKDQLTAVTGNIDRLVVNRIKLCRTDGASARSRLSWGKINFVVYFIFAY